MNKIKSKNIIICTTVTSTTLHRKFQSNMVLCSDDRLIFTNVSKGQGNKYNILKMAAKLSFETSVSIHLSTHPRRVAFSATRLFYPKLSRLWISDYRS